MSSSDIVCENADKIFVGDVKIGMIILHNERPIKIIDFHTSKTGKHGSAKTIIKGFDIITDKHIEFSDVTSKSIWIPRVTRKEMLLTDLIDDHITVFDNEFDENYDYRINKNDLITNKIVIKKW